MNRWIALVPFLLFGCASNPNSPVPPPTASNGDTAAKYAQWSNEQLQLKCAQDRRELDRAYIEVGPPDIFGIRGEPRAVRQARVEELEAEMMRRDPSGKLLRDSQALQWNQPK